MFILAPSPPPPPFFTRRQANLSVGELKISHIISYLVQQFKTGVKLFTSVEGRKKTLYTVPLFILIIFFVEVIMSEIMGLSSFTFIFIPAL